MIKAGIIGSTGYAGAELVRLLLNHPEAEIVWYGSRSYVGDPYADIYGNFFELVDERCLDDDLDALADRADVIFTATPQGFCASKVSEDLLSKVKVIDLSADFRIKDAARYEEWYGIHHPTPGFLEEAVYGLPEIKRSEIAGARLIANPGCFPTCSILTIAPFIKGGFIDPDSVIIDAKSGTSGAGRGAKVQNLFCEVNETVKAYGVTTHRHTPEIEDQLGEAAGRPLTVQFTPHLIPMNRGILVTAYASLKEDADPGQMRRYLEDTYRNEPFVRVLPDGRNPETRWVRGSNYVDVGFAADMRTGRVIMMG
ncbi:MAG: N-acetyl-gamma-glutamyl-phosphate reductase, partial [Lachnospiraceae bacterium]|nr:N-acetyl-gamma-glutamyl-phosphate reductase [Lachnospiraceae bacterium]